VTALLGERDFAWVDGLRRAHFPADRNCVPAHLTLFHHLPPSIAGELARRLAAEARSEPPPPARIAGVVRLGHGVAFRVDSPVLALIRQRLADAFRHCLTPQDMAAWRPHVTVQNKVDAATAERLYRQLSAECRPRPLLIAGLATWRYLGGPWQPIGRHAFNRSGRSLRS